ncbi:uncharacterized protein LOC143366881 [Andrena cerasifolii]|uniref:uncharacterized protein LOC143366881 n=1 Tax=Andrena cerasifolii TaxID=2819439 RepID=UPI004037C854
MHHLIYVLMIALTRGLIAAAPTSHQAPYAITPITHKAGIHFTHLGKLYMITDSWKVVTHLRMDTLFGRGQQLLSYIDNIKIVCKQNKLNAEIRKSCNNYLDIVVRRAEKLATRLKQVSGIPSSIHNKRRGLINGLGSLAKTLFGTMDANDAEQINYHLAQLDGTQTKLLTAMKKQIQFTNNTLHHLHRVEETIDSNERLLDEQTRLLRERIESALFIRFKERTCLITSIHYKPY